MAGFLTRVAARFEAPRGMLRPRTPSLFEPSATAASVTAGEVASQVRPLEHTDEVDAPPVATSPLQAGQALLPQSRRPGRPADPVPQAFSSLAIPKAAPRGHALPPFAAEPTAGPEIKAAPVAPELEHTSATAIQPARFVSQAGGIRVRQIEGTPATAGRIAQSVAARGETRRAASRRSDAGETAAENRREAMTPTTRPLADAIGILQAPAAARIVTTPLHSPPSAQPSEPTVHVTIGRVEVRAIAATPSDRLKPERPSPVMSLDEYLRTRAR
jgi:hypothetical protein